MKEYQARRVRASFGLRIGRKRLADEENGACVPEMPSLKV